MRFEKSALPSLDPPTSAAKVSPMTPRADALDRRQRQRICLAVAVGSCFELYDFVLFSQFAVVLSRLFFPAHDPVTSLMLTLSTFGVGFVTRPIGAVVFGVYADKQGRRAAVVLTLALMTLGTAMVACAPVYASVGVLAPILLVTGRLIQGFGIGGEVGPSAAILLDLAPASQRTSYVSIFMAAQGVAAILAGLTGLWLNATFSAAAIESWAWRLPFLFGLLLGPVGMMLRSASYFPETARSKASPLRDVLTRHKAGVGIGLVMFMSGTSTTYVAIFYIPTYLSGILGMPVHTGFVAGACAGTVMAAMSLVGGRLSDSVFSPRLLAMLGSGGLAILSVPAFTILSHSPGLAWILVITSVLICLNGLQAGATLIMILRAFADQVRATGLALVYGLGVLVGGFAQLAVTGLMRALGTHSAPGYYMLVCSALSFIAFATARGESRARQ
ncbi:MHS family proline/betaine transporter-like MFS transporter [Sphingomonas trueperi]|uniref:MFS transporter n=1 Tax=Sphingomonas trueperi TaxID=53317 RepID=UPI003394B085